MNKLHIDPEWLHWPETKRLVSVLEHAGVDFRFVGGAVRDALLGRVVKDVDIATTANPETVMGVLSERGIKVIPTGIAHGTVTAVVDGKPFEITTLRSDVSCDGRHAEVEFTEDWLLDASRRDLTINALYATPQGHVWDYFSGIEDAKAGRIRFIGDANERIREDALRILRFFRFYAYYGTNKPDEEGLEACLELAHLIQKLSGERIQSEMLKLLAAPSAFSALKWMQGAGVLDEIELGHVTIDRVHALEAFEAEISALCRLAMLLRSLNAVDRQPRLERIASRWKLSNLHRQQLKQLLLIDVQLLNSEAGCKKQLRLHGAALVGEALLILAAEQSLSGETLKQLQAIATGWKIPVFPITGEDLKKRGHKPGKEMGELLAALETRWEESDYTLSKSELLE